MNTQNGRLNKYIMWSTIKGVGFRKFCINIFNNFNATFLVSKIDIKMFMSQLNVTFRFFHQINTG